MNRRVRACRVISNIGTCTDYGETCRCNAYRLFTFRNLMYLDICQESIGPFDSRAGLTPFFSASCRL